MDEDSGKVNRIDRFISKRIPHAWNSSRWSSRKKFRTANQPKVTRFHTHTRLFRCSRVSFDRESYENVGDVSRGGSRHQEIDNHSWNSAQTRWRRINGSLFSRLNFAKRLLRATRCNCSFAVAIEKMQISSARAGEKKNTNTVGYSFSDPIIKIHVTIQIRLTNGLEILFFLCFADTFR